MLNSTTGAPSATGPLQVNQFRKDEMGMEGGPVGSERPGRRHIIKQYRQGPATVSSPSLVDPLDRCRK